MRGVPACIFISIVCGGFVKDETAKNVLFGALPVDTVTYTELPGGR